ncbi:MAG: hypothetical protein LBP22_03875 [Deltaproteobacteria bacterium]|nr:hypothetical protein [Deltaproteobacteria bacterium]
MTGALPDYVGFRPLLDSSSGEFCSIGPLSADLTFKYSFRALWTAGLMGTERVLPVFSPLRAIRALIWAAESRTSARVR